MAHENSFYDFWELETENCGCVVFMYMSSCIPLALPRNYMSQLVISFFDAPSKHGGLIWHYSGSPRDWYLGSINTPRVFSLSHSSPFFCLFTKICAAAWDDPLSALGVSKQQKSLPMISALAALRHHAHTSRIQSHNFSTIIVSCITPCQRASSVFFPCWPKSEIFETHICSPCAYFGNVVLNTSSFSSFSRFWRRTETWTSALQILVIEV